MALWLVIVTPFRSRSNLYINISNEFILVVIFLILYLLHKLNDLLEYANYIGWVLIGLVCCAILQSWIIMFPLAVKIFKKKCCSEKKENENDNESSPPTQISAYTQNETVDKITNMDE